LCTGESGWSRRNKDPHQLQNVAVMPMYHSQPARNSKTAFVEAKANTLFNHQNTFWLWPGKVSDNRKHRIAIGKLASRRIAPKAWGRAWGN